jgi:hypothetical protein
LDKDILKFSKKNMNLSRQQATLLSRLSISFTRYKLLMCHELMLMVVVFDLQIHKFQQGHGIIHYPLVISLTLDF